MQVSVNKIISSDRHNNPHVHDLETSITAARNAICFELVVQHPGAGDGLLR